MHSSGAIDYIRSPLFGASSVTRYFGVWLFRRESLIGRFLRWLEGLRNPWIGSEGEKALKSQNTTAGGRRPYACLRLQWMWYQPYSKDL
jgi:hypothetical protein